MIFRLPNLTIASPFFDNIRQLVEQAAGASGGQNEERTADRIAQQTAELDRLIAERDALAGK